MCATVEESLIATPSQLQELVSHVRAAGRFGFDTEFVSEDTFEPVLCLVQVATQRSAGRDRPSVGAGLEPVLGPCSRPIPRRW